MAQIEIGENLGCTLIVVLLIAVVTLSVFTGKCSDANTIEMEKIKACEALRGTVVQNWAGGYKACNVGGKVQ